MNYIFENVFIPSYENTLYFNKQQFKRGPICEMVLLCNFFLTFAHPKVLQHASSSEGATSDSYEGPILVDKNPTPPVGAAPWTAVNK